MRRILDSIADFFRECDKVLFLLTVLATGYGCIAVMSATHFTGSIRRFLMQVVSALLGFLVCFIVSSINYRMLARFWPVMVAVGLLPVVLTFFIGYAPPGTDDKAWLILPGGVMFQPTELLKIIFIVTFATHLNKVKDGINKLRVLFPLCLHGAIPVLICHKQGDDGMALIFLMMFAAMLAAAGLKARYFVIALALIIASLPLIYFVIMNDTQRSRVMSMFNIEGDLLGSGWQQWRARIAMANGSFFGQGMLRGQLVQAGNIPEGYNDLIFVSIGEEFGFLGCLAVMVLLFAICARILVVAHRANDSLGCFICIGYFAMVASQTIINLGMCLSILPVVGITLPFFSYGGSSLACLLLGLGLVASVHVHRNTREIYIKTDF